MKRISYFLAWSFIVLGLLLAFLVAFSIVNDGKAQFGFLDWAYINKIDGISGIIAVLFTGAGTFAIFLTLIKQQEQFNQAQKQVETQQFETTFFNMLNQLFSIKNSLQGSVSGRQISGQNYLHQILNELQESYKTHLNSSEDIKAVVDEVSQCIRPPQSKLQMLKDDLNIIYIKTYNLHYSNLGHYFRFFFNLIKYTISNRGVEKFDDAAKYVQLIQAQLSNDELGLIFCNALSDKALNRHDKNKIFDWLEEYSVLENIDSQSLLDRSLYVLYPKTKFKFLNNSEKQMKY